MNINLANTHSLEIETFVAGNLHYSISYVDITSSSVSLPITVEGIITTVTTTEVVSSPPSGTDRKIQSINLYNDNTVATNPLIKKKIGGTRYNIERISLQPTDTYRVLNGVPYNSGIERKKYSNIISGESRTIFKIGTAPEAAGQFYCFSKDGGFPGVWNPGTPGLNGRNCDGTDTADVGCISVGNAPIGSWYLNGCNISTSQSSQIGLMDILWVNTGLSVTTTTAQAITQSTLPTRDNNGTSNGEGVQLGILVTTATTNASAITTITASYTNSDGVSGRTATISSFPATAVIGTFVKFRLNAGDKGVRSIQSITLGTTLSAGSISLILFEDLMSASCLLPNVGENLQNLQIPLYDGHCLLPYIMASNTTACNISGNIYFINK